MSVVGLIVDLIARDVEFIRKVLRAAHVFFIFELVDHTSHNGFETKEGDHCGL